MYEYEVAIIGFGPTGMVLANELQKHGISFIIIDKRKAISSITRAVNLTPASIASLQFSLGLNIIDKVKQTDVIEAYWDSKTISRVSYRYQQFPYRKFCYLPQPFLEKLLYDKLNKNNILENAELTNIIKNPDSYTLQIGVESGEKKQLKCKYLVGCDGNNSYVRRWSEIESDEENYQSNFFLYDVHASEAMTKDSSYYLFEGGYIIIVPIAAEHYRIILSFEKLNTHDNEQYNNVNFLLNFLQEKINLKFNITNIKWFTQSGFRHRIARKCHHERSFLAGDAFHIFSPIGGLNLNTGLHDAINLGWKLAYRIKGYSNDNLISTYSSERMFAIQAIKKITRHLTKVMTKSTEYHAAQEYIGTIKNKHHLKYILPKMLAGYDSYPLGQQEVNGTFFEAGHHISKYISNKEVYSVVCQNLNDKKFNLLTTETCAITPKAVSYLNNVTIPELDLNNNYLLVRPDGFIQTIGDIAAVANIYEYFEKYFGG